MCASGAVQARVQRRAVCPLGGASRGGQGKGGSLEAWAESWAVDGGENLERRKQRNVRQDTGERDHVSKCVSSPWWEGRAREQNIEHSGGGELLRNSGRASTTLCLLWAGIGNNRIPFSCDVPQWPLTHLGLALVHFAAAPRVSPFLRAQSLCTGPSPCPEHFSRESPCSSLSGQMLLPRRGLSGPCFSDTPPPSHS